MNGGSSTTCRKNKGRAKINGACSSEAAKCEVGIYNAEPLDTDLNYLWTCKGSYGGITVKCSKGKPSSQEVVDLANSRYNSTAYVRPARSAKPSVSSQAVPTVARGVAISSDQERLAKIAMAQSEKLAKEKARKAKIAKEQKEKQVKEEAKAAVAIATKKKKLIAPILGTPIKEKAIAISSDQERLAKAAMAQREALEKAAKSKTTIPAKTASMTKVNGLCGASVTTCKAGRYSAYPTDTAGHYLWTCQGLHGGKSTRCNYAKSGSQGTTTAPASVSPKPSNEGASKTTSGTNKINGTCGSTKESCQLGKYFDYPNDTKTDYMWTCMGSGGGKSTRCEQSRSLSVQKINGSCGSRNTCKTGKYNASPNDSSTKYIWTCNGIGGGTDKVCQELKSSTAEVNGYCGSERGTCIAGSVNSLPADTSEQYLWTCQGKNGGSNARCSQAKAIAPSRTSTTPRSYVPTNTGGGYYPTTGGGYYSGSPLGGTPYPIDAAHTTSDWDRFSEHLADTYTVLPAGTTTQELYNEWRANEGLAPVGGTSNTTGSTTTGSTNTTGSTSTTGSSNTGTDWQSVVTNPSGASGGSNLQPAVFTSVWNAFSADLAATYTTLPAGETPQTLFGDWKAANGVPTNVSPTSPASGIVPGY